MAVPLANLLHGRVFRLVLIPLFMPVFSPMHEGDLKKRYVLHPGVVSTSQGKRYFVSASTLARLYGVDITECRIAQPGLLASGNSGVPEVHLYPCWDDKNNGLPVAVTSLPSFESLVQSAE